MPRLFNRVFLRLGQNGRITQGNNLRAAGCQPVKNRGDRAVRINRNPLAAEIAKCGRKGRTRMDTHGVAEMLTHGIINLFRLNIQISRAIRTEQGKGQRDRGMRDILPTDVECPGD